jgi:hypothetical protein
MIVCVFIPSQSWKRKRKIDYVFLCYIYALSFVLESKKLGLAHFLFFCAFVLTTDQFF